MEKFVRASGTTYTEGWRVRSTQDEITWTEIPIEEIRTTEEARERGEAEAARKDEWQAAEREVIRKRKKKRGDYVEIAEIQNEITKRERKEDTENAKRKEKTEGSQYGCRNRNVGSGTTMYMSGKSNTQIPEGTELYIMQEETVLAMHGLCTRRSNIVPM